MAKQHPTETPEYWESLARSERSFAAEDRRRRYGSIESIRIHLANAEQYEAKALELRNEQPIGECPCCGSHYYDLGERAYHSDAECVGGLERFQ